MEGKLRGETENVNRRDADRRITNDPSGPERKGIDKVVDSDRIESRDMHIPFSSSLLVFRLNCLHHEARSRFEGGELEGTGSGDVGGSCTGSMPGCDLPVTIVNSKSESDKGDG